MSAVKAKFRCNSVTDYGQQKRAELNAVVSGSEENKSFAKYTPAGSLSLTIDEGTEANSFFEPGKHYYISIAEALQD